MIVIPMAGLSRRFFEAGYRLPKFMLPMAGGTVFDKAVASFSRYFSDEPFLFVARHIAGFDVEGFLTERCSALGITRARIEMLDRETTGQAETVEIGLGRVEGADSPITIFNIDTFRPGFTFPDARWFARSDGYLEVFQGTGANWSYVAPSVDEGFAVARTTEKVPISDLCCTGLYHFRSSEDFKVALEAERQSPSAKELYVAPLYNHLIASGRKIHWHKVENSEVIFCGVPDEYEALAGEKN